MMRTYVFLFETATKKWLETVTANSMFEAATKAKNIAVDKSKELASKIQFSFYRVQAL
ncbi:hypothetical protein [Brevibacillus dissolubilis]|uniref:hypothetical protein n=1 Tax=Brevibacillus dissolubilis TaxID=1844116 RepID=UPI00159BEA10|nr:hypothetical protein [Brevibacillus dissolubilis]